MPGSQAALRCLPCRLITRIAGWVAAQNRPVPPDDGSRQWDQTLAARLQAFPPVVRLASALATVANRTGPGGQHGRDGPHPSWTAGLRFRLLCAGALCTDGAPQVLLAAWHGPRATARRQQEAARLATAFLPSMLGAAVDILEEVRLPHQFLRAVVHCWTMLAVPPCIRCDAGPLAFIAAFGSF